MDSHDTQIIIIPFYHLDVFIGVGGLSQALCCPPSPSQGPQAPKTRWPSCCRETPKLIFLLFSVSNKRNSIIQLQRGSNQNTHFGKNYFCTPFSVPVLKILLQFSGQILRFLKQEISAATKVFGSPVTLTEGVFFCNREYLRQGRCLDRRLD